MRLGFLYFFPSAYSQNRWDNSWLKVETWKNCCISIPGPLKQGTYKKCMWPPFPQFSRHRMYLRLILTVDSPQFTSIYLNFLKKNHTSPSFPLVVVARRIFPQSSVKLVTPRRCRVASLPETKAKRNISSTTSQGDWWCWRFFLGRKAQQKLSQRKIKHQKTLTLPGN